MTMSESTIHILGWVLIAAIWVFVTVGTWQTIRELRTVLRDRDTGIRRAPKTWAGNRFNDLAMR